MADKNSNLYVLHFQFIPSLYHKDKDSFMMAFGLAPDEFLANIYTKVHQLVKPRRFWQRKKVYPKENFKAYKKLYPDDTMISYVTLPEMEDSSHVVCKAYALVMTRESTKFYTIEESAFGTTCIGTVDENGHHINLGKAGNSVEENMEILHGFEAANEEAPAVEIKKTVNPDGSYVECIMNHRDNRAEIREYDAQGNCVRSTYGTFSEEPEISDEELDAYVVGLFEKMDSGNPHEKKKTADDWFREGEDYQENGSFETALSCFLEAAESGHPEALNRIGVMHYRGQGTPVDYEKAKGYFERAEKAGFPSAAGNLRHVRELLGELPRQEVNIPNREVRWKPKNIMDEVRMMVLSCSSPPIVGTPEENARRVMEKIEYFRENGVEEELLYELEGKILQFMPEFVAENFDEFFAFLKENISAIYLTVHYLVEDGSYDKAKKIADPLARYLERHKAELLDGHHCHANAFETALYTMEEKRIIPTPKAKDNYTAFLIDYVRILQKTPIVQNNQGNYCTGMEESRKYLEWILTLCPQNSAGWMYLGVSFDDQEEKQLECYKKALRYCYQKQGIEGEEGLTEIYAHLAMYYHRKNQIEVVSALKELITVLNCNSYVLRFKVFRQLLPANSPYQDVLRKHNIQSGFSDLVRQTVEFLADPRAGMQNDWNVETWIQEIRSIKL